MNGVDDDDGDDDGDLLERWRASDDKARDALFKRHLPMLQRFFRCNTHDEAQDLIHRTFEELSNARARFAGRSEFRVFLLGIARNVLYSHYRRQKKERAFDPEQESLVDLQPTASRIIADREEQKILVLALRRIPLDDQVLLALRFWESLTGPELAKIFDRPEGTIRARLRRAQERLRETLEKVAGSREALTSTLANLDDWLESLKHQMPDPSDDG